MKPMISAFVLLTTLAAVPLASSPASAGTPTCRGQEATHVGVPGAVLTTTPGHDVVVTNGARLVRTLNGDDVVCATLGRFVHIIPGGGDDLVDATEFDGGNLETALGNAGVEGSSGDDTYLGGDQVDQVHVWSGVAGDHKQIHLDGGKDYLNVDRGYPGRLTAQLGKDNDFYWNDRPRAGVHVDAEEGRDKVLTECVGCANVELYLHRGEFAVHGDPSGRAIGFEHASVINFGSRVLRWALVWGTAGPNNIDVTACHAVARGRAGDDSILVGARTEEDCRRIEGVAFGGGGDDSLTGVDGRDILRGGDGQDGADGRAGSDLCRAEEQTSCER